VEQKGALIVPLSREEQHDSTGCICYNVIKMICHAFQCDKFSLSFYNENGARKPVIEFKFA
jgi:hypothetical protein